MGEEQQGQRFLEALWGAGNPPGFIQTWTLADKRSEYYPHRRGIQTDGQHDTFTAMGTTPRRHGTRHRATAQQVCAIAGLWLDLDVKPGHLPSTGAAINLAHMHACPTMLVESGYGIHSYYLLPEPWVFHSLAERDEAASLSFRWFTLHQQAAAERGWHVDQLGDLARVMRLPGTLNCKDPDDPRPVRVLDPEEPGPRHPLDHFRVLLRDVPDQTAGAPTLFDGAIQLTGDTSALQGKLDALIDNSPEFAAAWNHRPAPTRRDLSPSAWDLCLATLAQGAMTDPELAALMRLARERHGHDVGKLDRAKYVADTIRLARSSTQARHHDTTTRRAA